MSSCVWMSRAQLNALVESLDTAEYPMLIHCAWGSERTGLVSAFAELLRPGSTLADARAQFSLGYLFVRINDGKVMAEHLDQYENWLLRRAARARAGDVPPLGEGGIQAGRAQSRAMAIRPVSAGRDHAAGLGARKSIGGRDISRDRPLRK